MNTGLQTAAQILVTIGFIRLGAAIVSPLLRPIPLRVHRRDPDR